MNGMGDKGQQGEEKALCYLMEKGYALLKRRFHAPGGEIDLIVEKDGMLVFVEVKSRPEGQMGDGLVAVTKSKQRRIVKAAGQYLLLQDLFSSPIRFDVIELTRQGILHVENAFSGAWE